MIEGDMAMMAEVQNSKTSPLLQLLDVDNSSGLSRIGWTWMSDDHNYYSRNKTLDKRDAVSKYVATPAFNFNGYKNMTYRMSGIKLKNGDRTNYIYGNNVLKEKREDSKEENFGRNRILY